jgi:NAD(P)H-hydrate repair Nnr-like enzyme with NAD(P)H-hydrate dehydratase domain
VYLHGVAGDIAARESGEEYITASDIINHLGLAFKQIKSYQV